MNPCDQRTGAAVALDHFELPQGALRIERGDRALRHQRLQRSVIGRLGEAAVDQMGIQIEVWIVHPPGGATGIGLHALAKPWKRQQAAGQQRFELASVDRAIENHDPDDDHQVARPVHAQPGGIDAGHALAMRRFKVGHSVSVSGGDARGAGEEGSASAHQTSKAMIAGV